MPYITSTMTQDVSYVVWSNDGVEPNKIKKILHKILIKGDANVADPRTLITVRGVRTKVSEEDLEILRKNPVFSRQEKRGFLRVEESKVKVEQAIKSMEAKDKSAPLTPADYKGKVKGNRMTEITLDPIVNTL